MLRNSRTSYGAVTVILHWTVAALFFAQLALGYLTQAVAARPRLQFDLYQWHKSVGFLLLAVALLRVAWSLSQVRPRPLSGTPGWQVVTARCFHVALLALTLMVPLAGWAIVSVSPLRIASFAFDLVVIPDLPLARSDGAEQFWSRLHALLAYAGLVLAMVHAGAALHHHLVRKDATLERMLGMQRR